MLQPKRLKRVFVCGKFKASLTLARKDEAYLSGAAYRALIYV
jgi:hypothetical protein